MRFVGTGRRTTPDVLISFCAGLGMATRIALAVCLADGAVVGLPTVSPIGALEEPCAVDTRGLVRSSRCPVVATCELIPDPA
mmetsp:Transcript_42643/g.100329  ORF Transcript_42643/g.100329 Transcript_42643/m.100329 type:complete len:82 (+) Transcript_42643:980-1225(+)